MFSKIIRKWFTVPDIRECVPDVHQGPLRMLQLSLSAAEPFCVCALARWDHYTLPLGVIAQDNTRQWDSQMLSAILKTTPTHTHSHTELHTLLHTQLHTHTHTQSLSDTEIECSNPSARGLRPCPHLPKIAQKHIWTLCSSSCPLIPEKA